MDNLNDSQPQFPMCWKCSNRITHELGQNCQTLIGCKEQNDIKNYDDAKLLCPLIIPSRRGPTLPI